MSCFSLKESLLTKNLRRSAKLLSQFKNEDPDLALILQNLNTFQSEPLVQSELPPLKPKPKKSIQKPTIDVSEPATKKLKLHETPTPVSDELTLPVISPPRKRKIAVKKVPAQVNTLKFASKMLFSPEKDAYGEIPKIKIKRSADRKTFQNITNLRNNNHFNI